MSPKRRAKGDGTLFQRRDGYWVGGVELPSTDGKRRYKRIVRKQRNDAVKALKDLRKDLDAGRIPTTSTTTVQRWLEHWVETIQRPAVKPTTYKSYADTIRLYLTPTIGTKRLEKLTPEDVRQMHRTLQKTSSRNAQKAHQVLQAALKSAVNEGLIARNVAQAVNKPKHTPKQQTSFSFEVSQHILRTAISSCDEMWATRWVAGFFTGARESELLGLTWDRIDLEAGTMNLAWQLQYIQKTHGCGDKVDGAYPCGYKRMSACPGAHYDLPFGFEYVECERSMIWTRPKSKAGTRVVDLIDPLYSMLKELKAVGGYNPHQLVFHQGGSPIDPSQDRDSWERLLVAAEVPHVKQHTVRHSTATLLQGFGIDEPTRMRIMGHSSVAAQRGYLHIDRTHTRKALEMLKPLLG